MPILIIDEATGQEVLRIDEGTPFAVGETGQVVVDDKVDRNDPRPDEQRSGTIMVKMSLINARRAMGRKVVVFLARGRE